MYQKIDKFEMVKHPKKAAKLFQKLRWQGKVCCLHCGCLENIKIHFHLSSGLKRYLCLNCRKTFSDTTGTIFESSKIPLWKWMFVLLILFESTGSLSAAEVSRNISISYKSALGMLKDIRGSLYFKRFEGILSGIVESDEAWISKKDNQTILLGMVERGGSVKLFPIQDRTDISIYFPHRKYVKERSLVCSDGHSSYNTLNTRFVHHWVNHSAKQFVWRDIHTNTIEGVWSMLKGVLRTIHHGVWKKYLMNYCDLFSFMYSNRHLSLSDKFSLLFSHLSSPRSCTY